MGCVRAPGPPNISRRQPETTEDVFVNSKFPSSSTETKSDKWFLSRNEAYCYGYSTDEKTAESMKQNFPPEVVKYWGEKRAKKSRFLVYLS